MARVAVLHQFARSELGHVALLRDSGLTLEEHRVGEGDPLPDLGAVDGLVVLGGDQSAVRASEDPVLAPQIGFIREAVAGEVPLLGICLGAQLLAYALGGAVRHVGRSVEWRGLERIDGGRADPLVGGMQEPVPALHWNEDVFDLPPGGEVLLGPAPDGVEAFRAGGRAPAWGVQYHPDVDGLVLEHWLEQWPDQIPDEVGFREQCTQWMDAQAHASRALFAAFARIVGER